MVCAGDPAVYKASGNADDLPSQFACPHDDLFKHRSDSGAGRTAGSDRGVPAGRRRVTKAADEVRCGGV